MRGFRFGLTGRGLALVIAGALLGGGAAYIGEPDLAWLGVFLAALPLVGLIIVLCLPPRLAGERSVAPESVPLGETARVHLVVTSSRTASFSSLDFRDLIPDPLGQDARFELTRGLGRWRQAAGYDVAAGQRGHYRLGPLKVRNSDPFAVAWRSWQVPGEMTSLRVTPRLWELPLTKNGGISGASGDATPQRIGQAGADDVLVREHRHGDGMRRVHWRMSAKRGELMVRLEEQPWDPAMAILVDTRAGAHLGTGPRSTMEWAISFTASLATELLQDRFRVSLVGAEGLIFKPIHGETMAPGRLLAAMTDLAASGRGSLEDCLADPEVLGDAQTVVACLGLLQSLDAVALVAATTRVSQLDALVPDAHSFGVPVERATAHDEACRLLTASGWNVAHYGPNTTVPEAWHRLTAQREAR
ncbi:MAG: DUF58 domain-containing protein [Propionibacteriaceae bacterium]|nr:DUF58 domain-containing protein [Propionibacteriaceae bacterium]